MEATEAVTEVLDTLVTATASPVSVNVSDTARDGLRGLRDALDEHGLGTFLKGTERQETDPLARAPSDLTDPESLKYFQLYRESYTAEALQLAFSTRHLASSIARPQSSTCASAPLLTMPAATSHRAQAPCARTLKRRFAQIVSPKDA